MTNTLPALPRQKPRKGIVREAIGESLSEAKQAMVEGVRERIFNAGIVGSIMRKTWEKAHAQDDSSDVAHQTYGAIQHIAANTTRTNLILTRIERVVTNISDNVYNIAGALNAQVTSMRQTAAVMAANQEESMNETPYGFSKKDTAGATRVNSTEQKSGSSFLSGIIEALSPLAAIGFLVTGISKLAGLIGNFAKLLGPVAAVTAAAIAGFKFGEWLDKKFGISASIVDHLMHQKDQQVEDMLNPPATPREVPGSKNIFTDEYGAVHDFSTPAPSVTPKANTPSPVEEPKGMNPEDGEVYQVPNSKLQYTPIPENVIVKPLPGADDDIDSHELPAEPTQKQSATGAEVGFKEKQDLMKYISTLEGGKHGYNALVYGKDGKKVDKKADLTNMTIEQVLNYQKKMMRAGHASTAVGMYQFVTKTLQSLIAKAGISKRHKFTPEIQDKLASMLIEEAGWKKYKTGEMSIDSFQKNLSNIWPSLKDENIPEHRPVESEPGAHLPASPTLGESIGQSSSTINAMRDSRPAQPVVIAGGGQNSDSGSMNTQRSRGIPSPIADRGSLEEAASLVGA